MTRTGLSIPKVEISYTDTTKVVYCTDVLFYFNIVLFLSPYISTEPLYEITAKKAPVY